MDFWLGVIGDVISGVVAAACIAVFAFFVIGRLERRWAAAEALKARDLAAATALYQAHGELFAAWKVWEFHSRGGKHGQPLSETRRSEIVGLAASAEGGCESLLIRIALEHDLDRDEEAALWCLRMAFKELRYAIRADQPLNWWRSDSPGGEQGHREYHAFKATMAAVAAILTKPRNRLPRLIGSSEARESSRRRTESLGRVTGNVPPRPMVRTNSTDARAKDWVLVAEQITRAT